MKILHKLILAALLCAAASVQADTLDLDALIDEALANNPELKALKHRWTAFEARVPRAGALEDPIVRFEAMNLPITRFGFGSMPMSGKQLRLSQTVPMFGLLRSRQEAAEHLSLAAAASLEDRELLVIQLVRQAYYDLAFFDRALAITEKSEELLQDIEQIARTQYAVGTGLQQDVLQARMRLASLEDRRIDFETGRQTASARLNLLLNRVPRSPVGKTVEIGMPQASSTEEDLQDEALEQRPILRELSQEVDAWRATERAARAEAWPRLTFSIEYTQRESMSFDSVQGEDFLSVGIGLNLPVFIGRKQRQKAAEARSNINRAEALLEAERRKIFFQIRRSALQIEQHRREHHLFRTTIVPLAEMSLKSTLAAYQVGKVEFSTVMDRQIDLLDSEIMLHHHHIAHLKLLAEVETIVGKKLERIGVDGVEE